MGSRRCRNIGTKYGAENFTIFARQRYRTTTLLTSENLLMQLPLEASEIRDTLATCVEGRSASTRMDSAAGNKRE